MYSHYTETELKIRVVMVGLSNFCILSYCLKEGTDNIKTLGHLLQPRNFNSLIKYLLLTYIKSNMNKYPFFIWGYNLNEWYPLKVSCEGYIQAQTLGK